jgi:hypothetical protein
MHSKQKKTDVPKQLPRNWVIIIIVAAALSTVLFALLTYRAQESKADAAATLAADRAVFAKVEADMARTYDDIIQATGKPTEENKSKSCSRIAHKYEEGELFCNVEYGFTYRSSGGQAREVALKVENVLSDSSAFTRQIDRETNFELPNSSVQESNEVVVFGALDKSSCNLMRNIIADTGNDTVYIMKFTWNCTRRAIQPVYSQAQ